METRQLSWMVEQVKSGRMSRREFTGRATALGLGASAAATMLTRAGIADEPIWGGEATFGTEYTGAEETYDPTKMTSSTDIQRAYQTYNRLTNLDRDLNVVPNLAVEWEAANDATEWTFKLREGVEFHNGKTLTAEDVMYSINVHIREGSESPSKPVLAPIIDMRADGPNVIKFTLDSGNADFPVILAHDYHTSITPEGWVDGDHPVGTGPYALTEFTPGLDSVAERFANYWNEDSAYVSTWITKGIPDNAARTSALQSGGIDLSLRVEPRVAALLEESGTAKVYSTPSGSYFVWDMMVDRAPTNDLNVRLALKHALDRQYLVDTVLQGHGLVANDFPVNPGLPTYCREIPQHDYDPEKARWYWDKSGLSSIELAVSNAGHATSVDSSLILQENARAAGIEININRVPDDGYWSHTWMQVPFNVSGWNSRPTADLALTLPHACGGSWNETAWCNERFDELLVIGRKETDLEKRKEIYCEACTLLHDDGGAFIPFFQNYVEGASLRTQNYHGSSAFSGGAGWPYEEVWLDDARA